MFCFTSPRYWFRKLTPFCLPIRFKTKTDRDLVASVFPRFRQVVRFSLEFSLAALDTFLRPRGRCDYFEFGFTTPQRNALQTKLMELRITFDTQLKRTVVLTSLFSFVSLSVTSKQEGETFKNWYALLETDASLKRFKDALTSLASVTRWIKLAHKVKWT